MLFSSLAASTVIACAYEGAGIRRQLMAHDGVACAGKIMQSQDEKRLGPGAGALGPYLRVEGNLPVRTGTVATKLLHT